MQPTTGWMRIKKTMINAIETEEEYRKALLRFLEICEAPQNESEAVELILLIKRMEEYEEKHCPHQ